VAVPLRPAAARRADRRRGLPAPAVYVRQADRRALRPSDGRHVDRLRSRRGEVTRPLRDHRRTDAQVRNAGERRDGRARAWCTRGCRANRKRSCSPDCRPSDEAWRHGSASGQRSCPATRKRPQSLHWRNRRTSRWPATATRRESSRSPRSNGCTAVTYSRRRSASVREAWGIPDWTVTTADSRVRGEILQGIGRFLLETANIDIEQLTRNLSFVTQISFDIAPTHCARGRAPARLRTSRCSSAMPSSASTRRALDRGHERRSRRT
jgi:hypothetical protein